MGKHGADYLETLFHLSNDADVSVQVAILKALGEMHDSSHHYADPIDNKIGHFGVGSRAVYHLTDVPSLLSAGGSADDTSGPP